MTTNPATAVTAAKLGPDVPAELRALAEGTKTLDDVVLDRPNFDDDPLTDHGDVLVDSGRVFIVDPAHLPPELVAKLTTPNEYGRTAAVMAQTPSGDGAYTVLSEPGFGLTVMDRHAAFDEETRTAEGGPWGTIAGEACS